MIIIEIPNNWESERKWIANSLIGRFYEEFLLDFTNRKTWKIKSTKSVRAIELPDYFFCCASKCKSVFEAKPINNENVVVYSDNSNKYTFPKVFDGFVDREECTNTEFVDIDIFGTAFWCMSRAEEFTNCNVDEHQRWVAKNSHAYKNGYLNRPIVDQMVEYLFERMKVLFKEEVSKRRVFKQRLTHDVDDPFYFDTYGTKKCLKIFLSACQNGGAFSLLKNKIRKSFKMSFIDPFDTYDWLMDLSDSINVKSEFYFIPSSLRDERDCLYRLDDKRIQELISRIVRRDHLVGIHHSYYSYKNLDLMNDGISFFKINIENKYNKKNIEFGGRFHYLRWDQKVTPRLLSSSGVKFDGSLGYAEQPGFRAGTCFEYKYFDLENRIETELEIRPLIVMESSVLSRRYLNIKNMDDAFTIIADLKRKCINLGGSFNMLWHNSYLVAPKHRDLYKKIIELI